MDGGTSHAAAGIDHVLMSLDACRRDDHLYHALDGVCESLRVREHLAGLGAFPRLEQAEMDMVAVPPAKVYARRIVVIVAFGRA